MDAFYASVEERDNPALKGKPVVVGGAAESRGVVAAANYVARRFGVFSAMPMITAKAKCRNLVIVPPRGDHYAEVSKQIHEIFARYTPQIEPLSLDEAFLDVQGSEKLHGSASTVGQSIKNDIKNELNLVASVGVAPNKFLAKLASDYDKPDGFKVVNPEDVQDFLDGMPVSRIWGIGKSTQSRLLQYGISTVLDLRQTSETFLTDLLGKTGSHLWKLAHGEDDRQVVTSGEAKSVSQETTFATDIKTLQELETSVSILSENVCYRLRAANLKGKTVQLKLRFHDFSTITRSKTLSESTNHTGKVTSVATALLRKALQNSGFAIRLVGVGMSNFISQENPQQDLFDLEKVAPDHSQDAVLDDLSDQINRKYGKNSIRRGKSIRSGDGH